MAITLSPPTDLGLILSYQCQAHCAHCVYNCGKKWQDWIEEEQLIRVFKAINSLSPVPMVHLTGGEPFLNYPLLHRSVEIATEMQIACYLETNAGWCMNTSIAIERFTDLKEAGLGAVLISCSPFHAESIPPKNTLYAIQAALEIFGHSQTFIYQSQWLEQMRAFGEQHTTPLSRYLETFGIQRSASLFWDHYGLISGGRSGYQLGALKEGREAVGFKSQTCCQEILQSAHSHFDLYGNFIPGFCGGLSLGNWHDLPAIFNKFETGQIPEVIDTLITGGPYALYLMALDMGYRELSNGYAGKCHLCVDVRRLLLRKSSCPELSPSFFYENLV